MPAHPDIPELKGMFPVVLYFGSQADADEFIAIVREAKPGLVARSLPEAQPAGILGTGQPVETGTGPINPAKIEEQEREQHQRQRDAILRRSGNDQY